MATIDELREKIARKWPERELVNMWGVWRVEFDSFTLCWEEGKPPYLQLRNGSWGVEELHDALEHLRLLDSWRESND